MKIIVGKNAGFCYGVKRAVEGVEELVKKENKKIYCFGEIVHNGDVINNLKEKGVEFIEDLSNSKGLTVIRAHGISKDNYEYLKNNQIKYIDYTCPNVLNIHKVAEEYSKKGYYIFLIGDSKHPENIGTISFCGEASLIIEREDDVKNAIEIYKKSNSNKLLIIAQTTYSLKSFNNIVEKIKEMCNGKWQIVVKNTICNATEVRQIETEELSKKVDVMVIIGGKNSSNTKKLYDIALKNCKKAILVENSHELDLGDVKDEAVIGIMAGASTPQSSIEEVKMSINRELEVIN